MPRLIDADAMLEYLDLMYDKQDDWREPYNVGVLGAINYIKHEAPTIDAVSVVRCGECKYGIYTEHNMCYMCNKRGFLMYNEADFFCSYGERSEE